ncbi:hypothetical protein DC31_13895 [Microbacterium sp. CH12i]|uniref:hypothetical protein n=1 Tax=Microbacterium sp. CH12i TaxID=1479651 RepID=UPI000460EA0B|nr:hypothetical protein [Microbacterium sp. CH12i]KDA05862.1 hypothetical protein DC31_13895 [Microbacterium sp. CH12i]
MDFPFGRTVFRLRAGTITDPYSGDETPADWSTPATLEIPGAFVAQTSTSLLGNATREQAVESKSLFCEGSFDIQKGDRIRDGADGAPIYSIDGIPPAADTNPFTGWTPPREIPLTRAVG